MLRVLRDLFKRLKIVIRIMKKIKSTPGESADFDDENNKENKLPPDESIDFPAVWISELYTPSSSRDLLKGISLLGWDNFINSSFSINEWMNDVRVGASSGKLYLGEIFSDDQSICKSALRKAPLPEGVVSIHPVLSSVTPSITSLTVMFRFNNEVSSSINKVLDKDYKAKIEGGSGFTWRGILFYIFLNRGCELSYSIVSPGSIRKAEVNYMLEKNKEVCSKWFVNNFSGVFSSFNEKKLPSVTMLITDLHSMRPDIVRDDKVLQAITPSNRNNLWIIDGWEESLLALPKKNIDSDIVFYAKRSDLLPNGNSINEVNGRDIADHKVNSYISAMITEWSVKYLLNRYYGLLATSRDNMSGYNKYRPVANLKKFRDFSKLWLHDIKVCALELSDKDTFKSAVVRDFPKTIHLGPWGKDSNIELNDVLAKFRYARANQVLKEADLLAYTSGVLNDVTQTLSSIRLQRFVAIITVLSTCIAVYSLFYK